MGLYRIRASEDGLRPLSLTRFDVALCARTLPGRANQPVASKTVSNSDATLPPFRPDRGNDKPAQGRAQRRSREASPWVGVNISQAVALKGRNMGLFRPFRASVLLLFVTQGGAMRLRHIALPWVIVLRHVVAKAFGKRPEWADRQ